MLQAGNHGMEQNCHLKHPHKATMINVVRHPHMFSTDLPLLEKAVKDQMQHYDRFDSENDRALRAMILKSVDPSIRQEVTGLDHMHDGALVTWIKIVREWSIMTKEKSTAVARAVRETHIRTFPGMSVSLAVAHLKPLCASLMDTRDYDPLMLEPFLKSLHSAFPSDSPEHLAWWTSVHTIISRLKLVSETQKMQHQLGPCQIEDYLVEQTRTAGPDQKLDRKSVFDSLVNDCQLLVHSGLWSAANNPQDKGAAPPSFGAAHVHHTQTNAQANVLVENLKSVTQRKPLRPRSSQRPYQPNRARQPGHGSATVRTSNRSNGRSDHPSKPKTSWKRIPPKAGAPHTKTDSGGKVWKWCGKCNDGKGRWTASHTTAEHGKTDSQRPAQPSANYTVIHPCAWYTPITPSFSAAMLGFIRTCVLGWSEFWNDFGVTLIFGLLMSLVVHFSDSIWTHVTHWLHTQPLLCLSLSALLGAAISIPIVVAAVAPEPPAIPRWQRLCQQQHHCR